MTTLFDQEKVLEIEIYNREKAAKEIGIQEGIQKGRQEGIQEGIQKGRQEGRQEGIQEGRQEGIQKGKVEERAALVKRMLKRCSILDVSDMTGIPTDEIEQFMKQ